MKILWKRKMVAILIAVLLCGMAVLAGCTPRQEETPAYRIVTSFYPMYIMTKNITKGIDEVQVVDMAGNQAGCLHDYQLQSKDMQMLSQADLFVINGAGMESFLEKVTRQLPNLKMLDSSIGVPRIRSGETDTHSAASNSDEAGEDNPHMWVSISNYILEVQNIAAGLEADDPPRAARYRANADAYVKKLSALRERMHAALDPLPHRDIITFHEAFPYFAKEFHLRIVHTVQREPDSQPSARELAQTIRMIRKSGVRAVFAEPQYSDSAAQVIAQESGAQFYKLDPAATGPDDADAYLDAMEKNLAVLQKALA